ncbi:MAG: cytochrome c oxidase assembly protein, partial [Acidobacteriota bacterium]|nr:cytochrome c oxidase assembly protein [Acidobacteriota bacterium]
MTRWLPFHWHVAEVALIVAALVAHHVAVGNAPLRRRAEAALVLLAAVVLWPVGDLAASVSLTVATLQRLIVMLAVAPMLLRATPTSVFDRLTRPAPVDRVVLVVTHPGADLAIVTVIGTLTLITPVVDWGAHSAVGRDAVVAVTLLAGALMWLPVVHVVPGTRVLSPVARAGYLVAASIVVTSLSIVWIFARHPLYPALHFQRELVHMSPLLDQQIAGFVAKLGAYAPLWAIAFSIFARADREAIAP